MVNEERRKAQLSSARVEHFTDTVHLELWIDAQHSTPHHTTAHTPHHTTAHHIKVADSPVSEVLAVHLSQRLGAVEGVDEGHEAVAL
jgi:hypothetical protein